MQDLIFGLQMRSNWRWDNSSFWSRVQSVRTCGDSSSVLKNLEPKAIVIKAKIILRKIYLNINIYIKLLNISVSENIEAQRRIKEKIDIFY